MEASKTDACDRGLSEAQRSVSSAITFSATLSATFAATLGDTELQNSSAALQNSSAALQNPSAALQNSSAATFSGKLGDTELQQPAVAAVTDISDSALSSQSLPSDRTYLALKRGMDIVVATIALVLLLPVFVIVAIAIVIDNPGPVLFYQNRIGRDNKPFRFYKFRSMIKNAPALQAQLVASNEANGPIFKMRRDPRVTRVGRILRKYSIDELPQFFNVLRGEMSLVGPRPHLPTEVQKYNLHQMQRLTVQPGLVCLREVSGRSELTFEHWIEMDLLYIASRSIRTDLRILAMLIPAVFSGRGAY